MLGSQTEVINGQRFTGPTRSQFAPLSYGVQTSGVPQVSPTQPPYIGAAGGGVGGVSSGGSSNNVGGYGTADNNGTVTAIAAANPHNLKVSPVWWAVGALLVGLTLLNAIHWRKTTLETFHANGSAGPAHAEASESA